MKRAGSDSWGIVATGKNFERSNCEGGSVCWPNCETSHGRVACTHARVGRNVEVSRKSPHPVMTSRDLPWPGARGAGRACREGEKGNEQTVSSSAVPSSHERTRPAALISIRGYSMGYTLSPPPWKFSPSDQFPTGRRRESGDARRHVLIR